MTRERLEQIRESKEAARIRQYKNYQSGGSPKCLTRMQGYEDIVEICDLALGAIDDHNAIGHITATLICCARDADNWLHDHRNAGPDADVVEILREIVREGKMHGYSSPWT